MGEKTGAGGFVSQSESVPKMDNLITLNLSHAFENRLEPVLNEIEQEHRRSAEIAQTPRHLRDYPEE